VPFVWLDVGVAVLGLVVLAGFALRLFRQVRGLAREVSRATERIGASLAELERRTGEGRGEPGRIVG
jgi:heme exporter protein D